MTVERTFEGTCFCGAVRFRATGAPVVMGYCHCASCRVWSAGPVNAFTLWRPDALSITSGANEVVTYNKTPGSFRKWCKRCGGHLFTHHPSLGLVDVYAPLLATLPFEPSVHVHYGEAVVRIRDGLPKQRDLPKEMGGSGMLLPE